ncbi:glycoside hydrolase family 2 TIM barrel-domain containing protein [Microbacterium sp. JZ101]
MRANPIIPWRFHLGDEPDAWKKGFDDTAWRAVRVPHDWSVEQEFSRDCSSGTGYLPGGVGWYRAHVPMGELADAPHVRLVFHGVYKNAQVWANGYHLGGRPSGYAAFSFDLTEILSYAPDDDLVLSVRVDHSDLSDSRWYNGAGITRGVEIEVHEAVRLREYGTAFTTLSADADEAVVRVVQTLVNDGPEPVSVQVRHELRSLTSGRVHAFDAAVEVPAGGAADVESETRVPDPELWSDTDPHLHRLSTTLVPDRGPSARYTQTVGIRTVAFDADAGFSVNGEPRTLTGVCLHEDAGPFGTAVPPAVWLRRLLRLKEMGANAVRMAHNPHAPELYALCDALGLFVIDEAFDEWENPKNKWWQGHNVYPPRHEGYAKDFPEWHERDLAAMIDAHRGHPSIIAWSIGNEIDYPNDPYASPLFDEMTGNNDASKPAAERVYDPSRPDIRRLTTIARRLAAIVRAKDPTRPVTIAAAFPELSSLTGFLDDIDVVGYNYKEHLYEADHARFPDKPLLGSENGHGYADWQHVVRADYVAGQFLWTGIDYLGEAHGWPVRGSGAGLLTLAGFAKHTWHLRRSWWTDEPVAHLVTRPAGEGPRSFWSHPVSRAWEGGERVEVLCFAGGGEPRLTCGGDAIPLAWDDEGGFWTAETDVRSAPLVLEIIRDGAVVAQDELRARGAADRLDAVVWEAPEHAARRCADAGLALDGAPFDGLVQIECALRDADGGSARDERMVSVEVSGGELLGIENGDLADVTPYASSQRRTLEGRLAVFVRADAGAVVRLRAEGLPETIVECGP